VSSGEGQDYDDGGVRTRRGPATSGYRFGYSREELERLGDQHRVWAGDNRRFLARAGFGEGATVVDLGCGPGHTTPDLARAVGPEGRVIAVDRDGERAVEPLVGRVVRWLRPSGVCALAEFCNYRHIHIHPPSAHLPAVAVTGSRCRVLWLTHDGSGGEASMNSLIDALLDHVSRPQPGTDRREATS
jgi:hypothetical protein